MVAKVTRERRKFQNSALLLSEYLDVVLQEAGADLIAEDQDIHLDVEKLKAFDRVADVPHKDQVGLLLVLLKQLQPFLNVEEQHTHKVVPRRVAHTSMEENYSSVKERLKSRSPLARKLNESTEVIRTTMNKSMMSRNPPQQVKLAANYTTSKMSRQQAYSTHAKTLSTKAASISRTSGVVLPNLGTAMSRQQVQSRLGNVQSALTLNAPTAAAAVKEEEYPYANLAARRKLLRLQHLLGPLPLEK